MHIVLDSNIYAADYKLSGVAFKTLFDYIRRTGSRLVLPRIIREEVVCGFGRRLKRESKGFSEAHRKYSSLDIDNKVSKFLKPDIRKAMNRLRRKLMKPSDEVTPLYAAETAGVSIDDVFMRGVRGVRPSNDDGEELRDVIIWLWVLTYSTTAPENVAFVSQDSAFWSDDKPHPDIARDISGSEARLSIYQTIDEFLKNHAPAPTEITPEWFSQHFEAAHFERDSVEAATRELSKVLSGSVRDVHLDELNFVSGSLYEVAIGVQFTELKLSLLLSLTNIVPKREQQNFMWGGGSGFFLSGPLNVVRPSVPLATLMGQPWNLPAGFPDNPLLAGHRAIESVEHHLRVRAEARFSARIKEGEVAEISLDQLAIDRRDLYSQLYKTTLQE